MSHVSSDRDVFRVEDELPHPQLLQLVGRNVAHGVIITDAVGRTRWINPETERLTGYTLSDFLGRKPGELLQGEQTDAQSIEGMRRAIRDGQPFEVTVANYTRQGLLFWARISARPFVDDSGRLAGFISTQADVTRLRRLTEFNALLACVNQAIAASRDDISFVESICQLAVRHAQLELAWIGRPGEGGDLAFLARAGRASAYLDGFTISVDPRVPEGQGPSGMTWRERTANYSQSFSTFPSLKPWQQRARAFGLDASATMPIFRGGDIWAVFTVYHARSGIFDDELCRLLDTLARDISHGLDQIDLRNRERELADQLHREKELAQVTLASIEDGVITTDVDGAVTFMNQKAQALCACAEPQSMGRSLCEVFRIHCDGVHAQTLQDPVGEVLRARAPIHFGNNTILHGHDGTQRHIETSASPIFARDGELQGCVLVIRDVTERYEAVQKLQWQAHHDALTGLPNRFALEKRVKAAIEAAQAGGRSFTVGLLDLDDFKPVNDRYSHETGDRVLRELAGRIRARVRDGDFVARWAGDELVVVIENVDGRHDGDTLEQVLARLHEAVETPFDVGADAQVLLDMSMGVASYPWDGDDVDGLLRQADAAMYAVKADKYSRSRWWRHAALALSERAKEQAIDPYGAVAHDLLTKASPLWRSLDQEFVDAFYERLREHAHARGVLALLTPDELARLRQRQVRHLRRLMSPQLARRDHERVATRLGEVHAMIGVETSDIMAAMDDYGRLLRFSSQKLPWRIDARLALDSIMQSRLALEIQFESSGRDRIQRARVENITGLEALIQEERDDGTLSSRLVDHLSVMPCIAMALVGRPDERDHFVLEFSAGAPALRPERLLEAGAPPTGRATADGAAWRNAWLSGKIVILDRFAPADDTASAQGAAAHAAIRSAAFVPVLDAQGRSIVLIALFGSFPGQFSHASMRMWLETIQHMVTPALLRIEKMGGSPIDARTRRRYHELLFGDGLEIVVQPVVELTTGKVSKVEALARLRDGDRLLSPASFLPSFGKQDLRALFRMGLDRTLAWVAQWERAGLSVGASLNLPPSVLIATDCPRWIAEGIERHGVAPERLYLELLETEDDAGLSAERDAAIARLADIGVRLVMDDLGAGYASLQRMRTLPFHTVKIDQGLVRAAATEPSRTIPFIRSLIEMAQCLQLEVVVEGLETDELIDMARRLGAEHGQGYAIARPMPPADLAGWAADWNAHAPLNALHTSLGEFSASFRRAQPQRV